MSESGDMNGRVLALFELLKKKNVKKIKQIGEQLAEDVDDGADLDFEPEQIIEMMGTWMDACAAGVDEEVMVIAARVLSAPTVDLTEESDVAGLLKKVPKALDKQTPGMAEWFDSMTGVRFAAAATLAFGKDVFPPLGEVLKHPKCVTVKLMLEIMTGHYPLESWEDENAAAAMAMALDVAGNLAKGLRDHSPGNMRMSETLALRASCLQNMFTSAHVFLLQQSDDHPKSRAVIEAPTVVLELQGALKAVKPKPKEESLKDAVAELQDLCGQLLSAMPTDNAGATGGDATALLEAVKGATDKDSFAGICNMMAACTEPEVVDKLLAPESIESVLKVFQKIKKGPYDQVWQAFQSYLTWAVTNLPASTDAVADQIVKAYIQGPPAMMQPKAFVDVAVEKSPALAKALWSNFSAWKGKVISTKGKDTYGPNLLGLVNGVCSLPNVLDGPDLSKFCDELKQLACEGANSAYTDSVNIYALTAMRTAVAKDKTQVPDTVVAWAKQLKESSGGSRDAATTFLDAYEGRSLENAYEQIHELNAAFKEACGSIEGLKAYVDENVDQLKDFIGGVTKKLPVPVRFSSEQRYVVKKAMLLHFECQATPKTRCCALPEGTFTTETYEWNRWLKIGLSAAKVGKSILTADAIGDVPGIVDQVKGMYKTYTAKDDADFLTYISEPFLTSAEQDKLLEQLRSGGFFDRFCYDNQTAQWVCGNCHAVAQLAGPRANAEKLERACSDPGLTLPMTIGGMPPAGESLMDSAAHAKEAAMEVKKTTSACCDLFGLFGFGFCKVEEAESS